MPPLFVQVVVGSPIRITFAPVYAQTRTLDAVVWFVRWLNVTLIVSVFAIEPALATFVTASALATRPTWSAGRMSGAVQTVAEVLTIS